MTQEDKELLLKDLCARLPYHCRVSYEYVDDLDNKTYGYSLTLNTWCINEFNADKAVVKPYLRPMSSMTDEEKEEIAFIRDRDFQFVRKWFNDESIKETGNVCPVTCRESDYCNKKHFDYRTDDEGKTMIEKGLALEAPEGMYE